MTEAYFKINDIEVVQAIDAHGLRTDEWVIRWNGSDLERGNDFAALRGRAMEIAMRPRSYFNEWARALGKKP